MAQTLEIYQHMKFSLILNQNALIAIAFWSLCILMVGLTCASALSEVTFVIALLAFIPWAIKNWAGNNLILKSKPSIFLWFLAGYVLVCLLSISWSEYPRLSIRGAFKVLQQSALFVMILEIFSRNSYLRKFEIFFLFLFALITVNGYFQYIFGVDFIRHFEIPHSSSGTRVTSSFKSYGLFACFLIISIPYVTALSLQKLKSTGRFNFEALSMLILSGLGTGLLILTRSRGALLAFLIGIFVLLIFYKKWRYLLAALLLLGGISLFLPKTFFIHKNIHGQEQSLSERFELWHRAIDVIKAKPLTGMGINTYAREHQKYDTRKNWQVRDYYAHNGYLQTAAEIGTPGVLLFICFLASYFLFSIGKLKRLNSEDKLLNAGLLLGILNILFFSFADTTLHNTVSVHCLYFFLGLQLAYLMKSSSSQHTRG